MNHGYRGGSAGRAHLLLAAGILVTLGVLAHMPHWLASDLLPGSTLTQPQRVHTVGQAEAACAADSVDTLIGTLGCESVRRAQHRRQETLAPN